MKWTSNGVKDEETTVEAKTEAEARNKAMIARWGPSGRDAVVPHSPYAGYGLWLVKKEA